MLGRIALVVIVILALSGRPASAQQAPPAVTRALAEIGALPGTANLLVLENGREIGAYNADTPLAGGSQFKLFVALALKQQIEAGLIRYSDVVPLDPRWRVPGGQLVDWPDWAPLTVMTYSGFMIARSDNTGTDATIDIVGIQNIEPLVGRNVPLMNARTLYQFKNTQRAPYAARWRTADEVGRRAIIAELDKLPLLDDGYSDTPYALDIEWFFSAREFCAVMSQVQDMPILSIVSPLADKDDWAHTAFKGGSEPGVLGLTTWLRAADGRSYCISSTWNNPAAPLDQDRLIEINRTLIKGLPGRIGLTEGG
ncbi:MAG: serine hydrolase [Dehalococcoidia bacterium]